MPHAALFIQHPGHEVPGMTQDLDPGMAHDHPHELLDRLRGVVAHDSQQDRHPLVGRYPWVADPVPQLRQRAPQPLQPAQGLQDRVLLAALARDFQEGSHIPSGNALDSHLHFSPAPRLGRFLAVVGLPHVSHELVLQGRLALGVQRLADHPRGDVQRHVRHLGL